MPSCCPLLLLIGRGFGDSLFFRISGLEGDPVLILEPVLPRLGLVSRKVVCSNIFAGKSVALVTAESDSKGKPAVTRAGFRNTSARGTPSRKFPHFLGVEKDYLRVKYSLFFISL